jgi:hypothetical protein
MARHGADCGLGLNSEGVLILIALFFFCPPLLWLPWCIDECRCDPNLKG